MVTGFNISDHSPNKGAITLNQLSDDLWNKLDEIIKGLKMHRENKAILHFNNRPWPADATDEDIVGMMFSDWLNRITKEIFQCLHCGRLMIWHRKEQRFIFFSPDGDGWQNILSKDA